MNRRVSFHPLAEQELNEAAGYYDATSPGLGAAFLDEVERAVKQILEYPEAASLVNRVPWSAFTFALNSAEWVTAWFSCHGSAPCLKPSSGLH